MKKRLFSLLLMLAMLISILPVNAFAEEDTGALPETAAEVAEDEEAPEEEPGLLAEEPETEEQTPMLTAGATAVTYIRFRVTPEFGKSFLDCISVEEVTPETVDKGKLIRTVLSVYKVTPEGDVKLLPSSTIGGEHYRLIASYIGTMDGLTIDTSDSCAVYFNGAFFPSFTYEFELGLHEPVITPPVPVADLHCSKTPQELVTPAAAEPDSLTVWYKLGHEITWADDGESTSIPTASEAGEYTVWYRTAGTADYKESPSACVKVTVTHHGTYVPETPATCEADGFKAHYACECGRIFKDADCTEEITEAELSAFTTPGAHVPSDWLHDDLEHWKECTLCGKTLADREAHSDTDGDGCCDVCAAAFGYAVPSAMDPADLVYTGEPKKGYIDVPYADLFSVTYFSYLPEEWAWETLYEAPVNAGHYMAQFNWKNPNLRWLLPDGDLVSGSRTVEFDITKAVLAENVDAEMTIPEHTEAGTSFDLRDLRWAGLPEGTRPESVSIPVLGDGFELIDNCLFIPDLEVPDFEDFGSYMLRCELGLENYESVTATLWVFVVNSNTNVSELMIEPIEDFEYTGKAVKPAVTVSDGSRLLTAGKDYTVSYKNNVKVAAKDAVNSKGQSIAPTVIITGKGNYKGKVTATFNIVPCSITGIALDSKSVSYTGKTIKVTPALKVNGKTLTLNKDFRMEAFPVPDDPFGPISDVSTPIKEVGAYTVFVCGIGSYTGRTSFEVVVTDKIPMSKVTVKGVKDQYYTGMPTDLAVLQNLSLTYNKKPLVMYDPNTGEGDFLLAIVGSQELGTASIVLQGMNRFEGIRYVNYKVVSRPISKAAVEAIPAMTYTGTPCEPHPAVFCSGEPLTEGVDYMIRYTGNTKAGTASAVLTGLAPGFTGTKTVKFKILSSKVAADPDLFSIDVSPVEYAKGGAKPDVTVRYNGLVLTNGKDYTLTWANNNKVADADSVKAPTVTVNFKGGFSGKLSKTFTVTARDMTAMDGCAAASDVVFSTKANSWKLTKITFKDDRTGKALTAGTDYAKITAYYMDPKCETPWTEAPSAGDTVYVKLEGIRNFYGSFVVSYRITKASISGAKATVPAQVYTGSAIRPAKENITLKLGTKTVLAPEDFEIVSYGANINKGTGTILVRGTGNYGGLLTVKFSITARNLTWWYDLRTALG